MADIELPNPEELEEQKKDVFSKRVALCTALFAVILAITSLGGNNASKQMMLSQQQSSNLWAYYQSKVTREHLYRVEKQKAEAQLVERGRAMNAQARDLYEKNRQVYAAEEKRYGEEKREIEQNAKKLEQQRDIGIAKDPYFDYAEVLLQIAIVMASISILSGSRPVFGISIACAIMGSFLCLNGYLLLVRLPFLD
ncbi:MAG: DUF4337 domain-containing protein [Deltaproteobacteria bacterium]|jgi:Domain of unknown function (DUF4337)|nr:DUF4337 domain-containing protein [Deltaproteobacteria bacterium]